MEAVRKGENTMTHTEFALEVYNAVGYLLADVVTDDRVANTVRHLDVGDDLLLPSPAEVKMQLVWQELQTWMADEDRLLEQYPLVRVEGLCGASAHTWIEIHTNIHDRSQDPVVPKFIIDAVPALVVGGPLLILPGAPLALSYRKRKAK